MNIHNLQNYLRMYRRRTGLSEREVAYLLGCHCSSKESRYEHGVRCPNLKTVFAYETVYGAPPENLFSGIYHEVKKATVRRARALMAKVSREKECPSKAHKLKALEFVIHSTAHAHK